MRSARARHLVVVRDEEEVPVAPLERWPVGTLTAFQEVLSARPRTVSGLANETLARIEPLMAQRVRSRVLTFVEGWVLRRGNDLTPEERALLDELKKEMSKPWN